MGRRAVSPVAAAVLAAACAGGGAACGAAAQMVDQRVQPLDPSTRVEPGTADAWSGRLGVRALPHDQRVPTGFESVYELRRFNRYAPPGQERTAFFARVDGGVTAVFPRSVYREGRGGLIAQIPPDRVFYIGRLPASLTAAEGEASAPGPTFIDRTLDAAEARRREGALRRDPIPERAEPSIFGSEEFRQYRVGRLMQRAAGGALEF